MDERETAEPPKLVINLGLARYWHSWMRCNCCGGTGGTDADVFSDAALTCDACLRTRVTSQPGRTRL